MVFYLLTLYQISIILFDLYIYIINKNILRTRNIFISLTILFVCFGENHLVLG